MAHNPSSNRRTGRLVVLPLTTRTANSRMTASVAPRLCRATCALSVAAWSRWQASSRSRLTLPPVAWSDLLLECSGASSARRPPLPVGSLLP